MPIYARPASLTSSTSPTTRSRTQKSVVSHRAASSMSGLAALRVRDIRFAPGDVINGPLHSNDTLLICEATFNGRVTTSNSVTSSGGRLYDIPSGCGTATFNSGGLAVLAPTVGMPSTNSQMKRETRSDSTRRRSGPRLPLHRPNLDCVQQQWNHDGEVTVDEGHPRDGRPEHGGPTPAACGSLSALRSVRGRHGHRARRATCFTSRTCRRAFRPELLGQLTQGNPIVQFLRQRAWLPDLQRRVRSRLPTAAPTVTCSCRAPCMARVTSRPKTTSTSRATFTTRHQH